jgi:hypothetical protein
LHLLGIIEGHDLPQRSLLEAIVASLAIAAVPSSLVEIAEAALRRVA